MIVKFVFSNSRPLYKKPVNFLLRYFDNSPAGHFAIEVESYSGSTVYESVFPHYKKSKRSDWLKHYTPVESYDFAVPSHLQYRVQEYLDSMIGTPYAIPQIVLMGFAIVFKPLNYLLAKAILNHEKALICTEVGSRFVAKFMDYNLERSHDMIGLSYMRRISGILELKQSVWRKFD